MSGRVGTCDSVFLSQRVELNLLGALILYGEWPLGVKPKGKVLNIPSFKSLYGFATSAVYSSSQKQVLGSCLFSLWNKEWMAVIRTLFF